jgi:hypothetical protein
MSLSVSIANSKPGVVNHPPAEDDAVSVNRGQYMGRNNEGSPPHNGDMENIAGDEGRKNSLRKLEYSFIIASRVV